MNKKADVWVSTVLYTLITLAVIGLVLAAVQPTINKNKDRAIIEQSVQMLNDINDQIEKTSLTEGTQLMVKITLKKGQLIINSSSDMISWILEDSSYMYSQINKTIPGKILVLTEANQDKFKVSLTLNSSSFNITYQGSPLMPSENPYNLFIKNNGGTPINIQLFTG
jgi:type II secretory pathway pseudopilin PulG